jgi:hypothetical protein
MKTVIFAYITFITVTAFVFINSFFVSKYIGDISDEVKNIPSSTEFADDYENAYGNFMKVRGYLNFTVPHSDLAEIEGEFHEILGAIEAMDDESLTIAKSRLIGSLSHLKRLSGINTDSIF